MRVTGACAWTLHALRQRGSRAGRKIFTYKLARSVKQIDKPRRRSDRAAIV
jgi:hypothetical protein